jgi:hypothetical protein
VDTEFNLEEFLGWCGCTVDAGGALGTMLVLVLVLQVDRQP